MAEAGAAALQAGLGSVRRSVVEKDTAAAEKAKKAADKKEADIQREFERKEKEREKAVKKMADARAKAKGESEDALKAELVEKIQALRAKFRVKEGRTPTMRMSVPELEGIQREVIEKVAILRGRRQVELVLLQGTKMIEVFLGTGFYGLMNPLPVDGLTQEFAESEDFPQITEELCEDWASYLVQLGPLTRYGLFLANSIGQRVLMSTAPMTEEEQAEAAQRFDAPAPPAPKKRGRKGKKDGHQFDDL